MAVLALTRGCSIRNLTGLSGDRQGPSAPEGQGLNHGLERLLEEGRRPGDKWKKQQQDSEGGVSGCGDEGPEKEVTDGKSESQEIRDREVLGAPLCV